MNTKVKAPLRKAVEEEAPSIPERQESNAMTQAPLKQFFQQTSIPKDYINPNPKTPPDVRARVNVLNLKTTVPYKKLEATVNRIQPAPEPVEELPEEIKSSVRALRSGPRRFHGTKLELSWFRIPGVVSPAADRFGYMSSDAIRSATRLPFNATTQTLLGQLGELMGDLNREPNVDSHNPPNASVSIIPAGFTYFGQFVDHNITFDVSSSLEVETDAETINNLQTPALDLDASYRRGPGLDPFLYVFPSLPLRSTAIRFQVGMNRNNDIGGPSDNCRKDGMRNVTPDNRHPFRMPVEFAAAAYRFGHGMIRDNYFVNFNFPTATLGQVFAFNRDPLIPVLSNWVVDFNACFETSHATRTNNMARKIDSFMANGLESLPPRGTTGLMAILAAGSLRRGLAFGLPGGQGMAEFFGIQPMTASDLTVGSLRDEVALLKSNGGLLLSRTPLWYYILREAALLNGGDRLGPVGARIVAETFVHILKRDPSSYLKVRGGFKPILPSVSGGDFTVADMLEFSGVTVP